MKRSFFQAAVTSILLYGCTTWTLNKTTGEEARWQLHKNAACNPEQVLAATPHKTPTVRPPAPYHEKLFKLDEPDMQDMQRNYACTKNTHFFIGSIVKSDTWFSSKV